jgi:hypothetical protein
VVIANQQLYQKTPNGMEAIPFSLLFTKCRTCDEEGLYSCYEDGEEITPLWPNNLDLGEAVPDEVKKMYVEANAVRRASPNSFAVLIRRALEAICKDKGLSKRNLADNLTDLTSSLGLPETLVHITQATRLLGNMGAHYGKTGVSKKQVEALDEFFKGIIQYVYTAPAQLKRYNKLLAEIPSSKP